MQKFRFGVPETFVPTRFCPKLNLEESPVLYPVEQIRFRTTARGALLELPMHDNEQIFGFGLQMKRMNHTGFKLTLRVNSDPVAKTGDSHAPVPFFVSTAGYGIYIDTARYLEAYCGFAKKQFRKNSTEHAIATDTETLYRKEENAEASRVISLQIPGAQGVDLYIFEGENIGDIVAQYNRFSGGGCTVPEWGLGVLYRCHGKSDSAKIRAFADYFREKDIPCDILGLEPGWQSETYSCSYVWDSSRFPDHREMIRELREKNFHVNLWEHAYISAASPLYRTLYDYAGDYEVWNGLVPDFSLKEARDRFAAYHRDELIAEGIDGFKLDECDNGDYVNDWGFPLCEEFPSGMDGEQYHSLFGVLYMQTMLQALGDVQTFSEVRNAGALCASYPFVLYSDLYDHKDFIRGVVNSGFSGVLWAPELRHGESRDDLLKRMWTVVFSVQCVLNGWYCEEVPWLKYGCEDEVREILWERKRLQPRLKAAFDRYRETGIPPTRALVMDYTDDPETYTIDDEYLFCDSLLVAPMIAGETERRVYLPAGTWCDYWTGEPVPCGWQTVQSEKIPVFERKKNAEND